MERILKIGLISLISIMQFAFYGCDSDKNDEPNNSNSIVGHWIILIQSHYGTAGTGITFNSNNTGYTELVTILNESDDSNQDNRIYQKSDFKYSAKSGVINVNNLTTGDGGLITYRIVKDKLYLQTEDYEEYENGEIIFERSDKSLREMFPNLKEVPLYIN